MRRALVLSLSLCACGGGAHRREGLTAASAGRLDDAAMELRLALAEHPGDGRARAALGLVLLRSDQPGGALRELDAAQRAGASAGRHELAELRARRARLLAALAVPSPPPAAPEADLLLALERHLRGETEDFPDGPLRARLLLASALPAWAGPTRSRLAGEPPDLVAARAALPSAPLGARLLVALEAALAGDATATELLRGLDDGLSLELAAATVARLLGRADDEDAALSRALALPGGALAVARRGEVQAALRSPASERARAILQGDAPDTLGALSSRGLPEARPPCRPDPAALLALRRALARDLATIDRLARTYIDGEAAAACRAPDVILELLRARQAARALPYAEELVAESPDAPASHVLLARLLVVLDNPERAGLELTSAEAHAPRRGAAAAALSAQLRRARHAIDAIAAARLALSIADPPERWSAYEALVTSALAAGREPDAGRAFAAYMRELPPALAADAAARIRAELGVVMPPPWLPPGSTAARIAPARVADLLAAGDDRALLLIGLADDTPRGAAALEAYAQLAETRGRKDVARAARREAVWLTEPL